MKFARDSPHEPVATAWKEQPANAMKPLANRARDVFGTFVSFCSYSLELTRTKAETLWMMAHFLDAIHPP
jgi:hypothetical protein